MQHTTSLRCWNSVVVLFHHVICKALASGFGVANPDWSIVLRVLFTLTVGHGCLLSALFALPLSHLTPFHTFLVLATSFGWCEVWSHPTPGRISCTEQFRTVVSWCQSSSISPPLSAMPCQWVIVVVNELLHQITVNSMCSSTRSQ